MLAHVQCIQKRLYRFHTQSPLAVDSADLCFETLYPPQGLPPPPGLSPGQLAALQRDGGFLQQLLDNRSAEDYEVPVPLKLVPRRYQQEGVNWLAFLRRFGLHGILADVSAASVGVPIDVCFHCCLSKGEQGGWGLGGGALTE